MSKEIKQRGEGLSGRHKTGQDLKQMRETKVRCNTENELPGVPAVGPSCTMCTNCTNRSGPTKLY